MTKGRFRIVLVVVIFGVIGALQPVYAKFIGLPEREVFEILSNGRRVGVSIATFRKKGGDHVFTEDSVLLLRVMKRNYRLKTLVEVVTDFRIRTKAFKYTSEASGKRTFIKGEVVKNSLRLDINLNGSKFRKEIYFKSPAKKGFVLTPALKARLFFAGIDKRSRFKEELFEPNSISFTPVKINVRTETRNGKKVYRMDMLYLGQEVTGWFSRKGDTLESVANLGKIELFMKPLRGKEAAIDSLDKFVIKEPGMDIISSTAIYATGKKITNPKGLRMLKVEFGGVKLSGFMLNSHRQVLEGRKLVIAKEKVRKPKKRIKDLNRPAFQGYLKGDSFIQAESPEIVKTARMIVGNEKNAWNAARKISKWVFKNLKKQPVVSTPDALTVLRGRKGDCNEHTTLYVALARAAGIPAKMHVGIVFNPASSSHQKFLYHAWPSVYVGDWISLDPTWDQVPADPTHISFVEGGFEEQKKMMALVGNVEVRVLEAK